MHSSCIYFFPFISRPQISETTALGAAYAAGLAVGFWQSTEELQAKWQVCLRTCVGVLAYMCRCACVHVLVVEDGEAGVAFIVFYE